MKRTLAILIAALMLLSLAACGSLGKRPSEPESRASSSSQENTPAPKPTEKPTPEPESSEESSAPSPASSEEESSATEEASADGIRPEFKEAMDSYVAFYEEYADFMKKYKESDNALEMLGEYTEYMSRLADFAEKMDEWDEEEMSDEELKYYVDVQARVSKILIDSAE